MLSFRRLGMGSRPAIDGFPAPEALEVLPRAVKVGDTYFRTLAIVGWPREVSAGWLQPLLSWRGAADIALYFEPVANDMAAPPPPKQRGPLSLPPFQAGPFHPQMGGGGPRAAGHPPAPPPGGRPPLPPRPFNNP